MTALARRLRRTDTLAERLLWEELRNHRLGGFKWKRQAPRAGYVVDFYCNEARLVVEVDGWVHEYIPGRALADQHRARALEREGLRIVRFSNQEVIDKRPAVCEAILYACRMRTPSPNPLPRKRRVRGLSRR
jgi:very-short-patch-repair endonuclease